MTAQIPKKTKQWTVEENNNLDGLKFGEADIAELGDGQVLVKIHAASLNFRDIMIVRGDYPFVIPSVVPGSDGAGQVVAVGKHVSHFKAGDKVCTIFNQEHFGGPLTTEIRKTGTGGGRHGVLREYGTFDQHALIKMPETLSYLEASTLPCAALTAWNALFGLTGKRVEPGQWVLTQGTGGVSIFAVQFAKYIGARVIATTSSPSKARLLEKLGADHVINYNEVPEWGTKAKEITGGMGVDHILEIAGPKSMAQSLEAIKVEGLITVIGSVAGRSQDQPGILNCLTRQCTTRGILVGSKVQFEEMNRAIEAAGERLKPVIDAKVFKLEEVKDAMQYQVDGKHQGKVCIAIA